MDLLPFLSKSAEIILTKAIIAPTERSIPPVNIATASPIATNY